MDTVLLQRVVSAFVLMPLVLAAAYLGGPYFAAVVAVAALLAGYEFYHIAHIGGYTPSYAAGLLLIVLLLLDAYWPLYGIWRWGIAGTVMLLLVRQILQPSAKGFLTGWALTLVGALYVGGLLAHMISLRNLPGGRNWLLLTLAVTWVCDSAAYFVGSRWGKHGFFSQVSPRKTWEGAIAGFAGGILTTLLAGHWLGLTSWQSLLLGVILVLGVTFGDLAESLVKRQLGVKDSSTLIPGHGGMLDRADSLQFAGVIVYYFAIWVARAGA